MVNFNITFIYFSEGVVIMIIASRDTTSTFKSIKHLFFLFFRYNAASIGHFFKCILTEILRLNMGFLFSKLWALFGKLDISIHIIKCI
jgi:hypothetical protein